MTAPPPEPRARGVSASASPPDLRAPSEDSPLETLRRFAGAIPLALFVFVHLALQASAHFGARAYEAATAPRLPRLASLVVSAVFVFAPLVLHAALGLRMLVRREPRTTTEPPVARATLSIDLARRASAIVLALFLVAHLAHVALLPTRDPELAREMFSQLSGDLSRTLGGVPLVAVGYLVGVTAAVTHASSGLYAFGLRALSIDSDRARGRLGFACFAWGTLAFALGVHAVLVLSTGVGWIATGGTSGP